MRDIAIVLGQNMQAFDLRALLMEENTEEFLTTLQKSPELATAYLHPDDGEEFLLSAAIRCNNFECAKALVEAGADVNIMDNMRKSILLEAIQCEQFKLAKLMMEKGAKFEPKDVGDYGSHLRVFSEDGFMSEADYLALINNIKNEKI
jgi:ankyrin repeat protein